MICWFFVYYAVGIVAIIFACWFAGWDTSCSDIIAVLLAAAIWPIMFVLILSTSEKVIIRGRK